MTTATRYDAIDLFDQVLNNVLRPRAYDCKPQVKPVTQEVRLIRLDVSETDAAYLVAAELPGVRKEDIKIDLEGKQLVISAQSPVVEATVPAETGAETQVETPAPRALLVERFQGKMTRRLQLPQDVEQEGVQAKYQDGILALVLPKQKPRVSRRVEIM